ncbi:MAG: phenylalanine--tRNA ligase subunit beta [Candidatus Aminicenantales bacterium]
MKISLNWIRDYVDVDLPLQQLLEKLTMIGLVPEGWEEKDGDIVLDISTYANRPDTLGHIGIARELAAALSRSLLEKSWSLTELPTRTSEIVDIQVLDEDLCPRYCGLVVKGIQIGPSPDWLRKRIEALGLKPISNIVDVTNYVLYATAQPIHSFDLAKVTGQRIIVRRAKKNETLRTLEGEDVTLSPDMLVIADENKPVALAGIIGGEWSGISDTTQDVFIESAYFDPVSIRRTSKSLGIQTDASYRFERGADIMVAPQAAVMAASLLTQFGGKATKEAIDIYPKPKKRKEIVLRHHRVAELLGIEVKENFIRGTLESLGFIMKENQKGTWQVQVPSFRVDIEREADLIEEIARFYGYDKIPSHIQPIEVLEPLPSNREKIKKLSQVLFHNGFDEVINFSFSDTEREVILGNSKKAIEIRNPISSKASLLRTALLSGLLETTVWNKNRGIDGIHIFEIGNVYFWEEDSTSEELHLGLSTTGPLRSPCWQEKPRDTQFYTIKGALEALMSHLRYEPFSFKKSEHPFFEKGNSLSMVYKGETVGRLGLVHRRILNFYELKQPVYAAELNLSLLFSKQPRPFKSLPLPKFPSIVRDLSFLVDRTVAFQDIKKAIEKISVSHLEGFDLIDYYEGEPVPKGKKSLSLRFIYRHPKATLLAEDVDKSEQKIIIHLKSLLGIQLREGGRKN